MDYSCFNKPTDYLLGGGLTLRNGRVDKLQFEEGYCQATEYSGNPVQDEFTFQYYDRDHLGNIRQVVRAASGSNVVQTMAYYPFGAQFCPSSTASEVQSRKYNGKEFDKMHGLNTYDYGARQYNPVTARWDRMDPLCEKYYNISPYAYCGGDPVNRIDPDGRDSVYFGSDGSELYRYGNHKNTTYIFVIKTYLTTKEMYPKVNTGKTNPISRDVYEATKNKIEQGEIKGIHMKNVTSFKTMGAMKAALKSIKDNGNGGPSDNNNREYSGDFTINGVKNTKMGRVENPLNGKPAVTVGTPSFHSHPSGTRKKGGEKIGWQQPPSQYDIQNYPKNKNGFVFGMESGIIYKYNRTGVISILPISVIK